MQLVRSALLLALVGALLSIANAKIIYVQTTGLPGGDGTLGNPFSIWRNALDNATSGDTIQFGPGRFNVTENNTLPIDKFKTIVIAGNPGPNKTWIDGTVVFGYTVTQWWPRHCESVQLLNLNFNFMKIRALNTSRLIITNCSFINSGDTDGAIYGSGTSTDLSSVLTIENTLFRNSQYYSVFSDGYATVNVINSRFMNNSNSYNYQSFKTLKTQNLVMNNNIFWKSTGLIASFLPSGASMTMTNNNFFNTYNPTPSITCEMSGATPVYATKNLFCGDSIPNEANNIQGCGTWPELYNQSPADSCGICMGTNANMDCNGQCWSDPAPVTCLTRNTYYVSPTGNDTFSGNSNATAKLTIKAAMALTGWGDTVVLDRGTYTGSGNEQIPLPQGVTIKGCTGCNPDEVIVGYTTKEIFYLNNTDVSSVISGITIANSTKAGVFIYGLTPNGVTIRDSIFKTNTISVASYGLSHIDNCVFLNNLIKGGAVATTVVYNRFFSGVTYSGGKISNSKFKSNTGNRGGAVLIGDGTTVAMTNNDFVSNRQATMGYSGGAINLSQNGAVWLSKTTFSANSMLLSGDGQDIGCASSTAQVLTENVIFCHTLSSSPAIGCAPFNYQTVSTLDACGACYQPTILERYCNSSNCWVPKILPCL